jgi:hypothetical protein
MILWHAYLIASLPLRYGSQWEFAAQLLGLLVCEDSEGSWSNRI